MYDEGRVGRPHRPGDAGELVGERDGGGVVAAALGEGERPLGEAVRPCRRALGVAEHGASAVGEEHAQVGIAAFADGAEAAAGAAGVFAGG